MTATWYANDAHGASFADWGYSTEGVVEHPSGQFTQGIFFEGTGTATPCAPGFVVCRPPESTGHFVRHLVAFFATLGDFAAGTSIDGTHDMYDADYLRTLDPAYPTGYTGDDVDPVVAPAGTAYMTMVILDEGPYDGAGTTTATSSADYSPYTDINTAIAGFSACTDSGDSARSGTGVIYRVVVRDHDLVELGPLPFLTLLLTPRFNAIGTWELTVDGASPALELLEEGGGILVYEEGNPDPIFTGPWFGNVRDAPAKSDVQTVTLSGYDDKWWLSTRVVMPDPTHGFTAQTAAATYTATAVLETLCHDLVKLNAGSSAITSRRIAHFTNAPDLGRGVSTPVSSRFDQLDTLLQTKLAGSGLGYNVKQEGSELVFRIFATVDRSATVTLSRALGNLADFRVTELGPTMTDVAIAGQGEGIARNIREAVDTTVEAVWHLKIEGFLDRRDTNDNTTLDQAGLEALIAGLPQTGVTVTPIDIDGMRYGTEYGLGDTIRVEVGPLILTEVVQQVTITSNGGEVSKVSPLVGSDGATHPSVPPSWKLLKRLISRVGLIERRQ